MAAAAPYDVPVTMKTRKGIDDDHLTYLDAGRIAQESGCAAIALHGRTVAQAYSGAADWDAIAALVAHVDIPVLGNGDIWEAADALLRMVEQTRAAGVVVGRGCLGRPGCSATSPPRSRAREVATLPTLGEVTAMMRRHAELLCHHLGRQGAAGVPQARHVVPQGLRRRRRRSPVARAGRDPGRPRPPAGRPRSRRAVPGRQAGRPRGRQGSPRAQVVLPEGWLDDARRERLPPQEEAGETTGG